MAGDTCDSYGGYTGVWACVFNFGSSPTKPSGLIRSWHAQLELTSDQRLGAAVCPVVKLVENLAECSGKASNEKHALFDP